MKKQKKTTKRFESTEIKQSAFVNEDYKMVRTFFIVLIIVVILVGGLFYFNGKLVTKDVFNDEKTTTTEPSYDDKIILADDVFKQKDSEYLVLIYDTSSDESAFLYDRLFNSYKAETSLYAVDLANKMNKEHYNANLENENTNPTKSQELVVAGPRLIRIKDGKVSAYLTNKDEITEVLTSA